MLVGVAVAAALPAAWPAGWAMVAALVAAERSPLPLRPGTFGRALRLLPRRSVRWAVLVAARGLVGRSKSGARWRSSLEAFPWGRAAAVPPAVSALALEVAAAVPVGLAVPV